jgi:hypothetical protein
MEKVPEYERALKNTSTIPDEKPSNVLCYAGSGRRKKIGGTTYWCSKKSTGQGLSHLENGKVATHKAVMKKHKK